MMTDNWMEMINNAMACDAALSKNKRFINAVRNGNYHVVVEELKEKHSKLIYDITH